MLTIKYFSVVSVVFVLMNCTHSASEPKNEADMNVIFLHHSTGEVIWNGGVPQWIEEYNFAKSTTYRITEQNFPKARPYGWKNYPYDYWNIWVNLAGDKPYLSDNVRKLGIMQRAKAFAKSVKDGNLFEEKGEPTLEILSKDYDLIIWKHCFPGTNIKPDTGTPKVTNETKRLENYTVQYKALKQKMHEFPATKFLVWTGAAQVKGQASPEEAQRAREFANWVKNDWDEAGDNIFIWDFRQLETEGGLYLKTEYARNKNNSHPNEAFARRVAPLFGQRIVDVLEGRGDETSILGDGTAVAEG
ncbi:MAG: hypothetical protein P8Y60_02350 [Calditrichota bacterium]